MDQESLSEKSVKKLYNGVEIPIIGLGTWAAGGPELKKAIIFALQNGYRHVDTAFYYHNEKEVGDAVRESGCKRKDIFITTKIWNDDHGYENAQSAFQKSLKNLQMDYVDLLLIHWPVSGKRVETWKALEKIYENGEARAIGVSNYMISHLKELESANIQPMVNQFELHPWQFRTDLISYCKQKNIQIESYSPLTRATKLEDPWLKKVADKYKKSPAQILIRWGLEHGFVTLPKSVKPQRITENLAVFDFHLENESMKALDNISEQYRVTIFDPDGEEFR